MKNTPDLGLIIVATKHFAILRDFYLAVLEPELSVDVPVYCEMRLPKVRLGIYDAQAYRSNLGPSARVAYSEPCALNPIELYFYPPDPLAMERAILAHGGEALAPAEHKPWGDDVAYFRDPDGNVIAIAVPPAVA